MQTSLMFLCSALSGVGGVLSAAVVLLVPDRYRRPAVASLVSYAAGALLGTAFLAIIPEALEHASAASVMGAVLAGVLLFFVAEKLVIWRHCHADDCERHGASGPLIVIGDGLHNFVDGILIAAAFLTSIPIGIAAAVATLVHEIPQEIGDFAILLESGYSRRKALLMNLLSSLATLAGTGIAYLWLDSAREAIPIVLGLSAGSLVYISTADLIPGLHRQTRVAVSIRQTALLLVGTATVALLSHSH